MRRMLIVFLAVTSCCSPALSETLNSFRHAHGLPALHRNGALQALAQHHARSMALRRTIDHSGLYSVRGRSGARAENVAAGCGSESCAVALWATSPGHRENMLLADVHRYGLASAAGGGERYWCLVLGR
jgi:uncharacterized protein YkwD